MKKILFIDEEKELQAVILKLFPKQFYRVIAASDGIEGLQKCRNEVFDLIILDYRMPKLNGVKFYQQIREMQDLEKTEMTPIFFVTAYLEELLEKSIKWEKCEFIEKPYDPEELLKNVNRLFGIGSSTSPFTSEKRVLNPGEILFDEGDPPDAIYLVLSGLLGAYKKSSDGEMKPLLKIGSGEIVGEVSVLAGIDRIARVVAEEKTEIITVSSEKILIMVNGQPKWIKLMLDSMSRRLQEGVKQSS